MSQFHYGSITTMDEKNNYFPNTLSVSIPLWFDYNTKSLGSLCEYSLLSQFHYGSITTYKLIIDNKYEGIWSQFHYGSITTQNH